MPEKLENKKVVFNLWPLLEAADNEDAAKTNSDFSHVLSNFGNPDLSLGGGIQSVECSPKTSKKTCKYARN